MNDMRKETDSLGIVEVPADKLWGAQAHRSLEHFSIGSDLMPRELITAYATLKKGAAAALRLAVVAEAELDRIVDPRKMVGPYVASLVAAVNPAL